MTTRIFVASSPGYGDWETIRSTLADKFVDDPDSILMHGVQSDADRMAEITWASFGGTVERWPAAWGEFGKPAGLRRTSQIMSFIPDSVILFMIPEVKATYAFSVMRACRELHIVPEVIQ